MIKVRISGALKTISSGKVKCDGDVKSLARIAYYNGTDVKDLKVFTIAMTVAVSPLAAEAEIFESGTAVTNTVTVTPTGGQGPHTYAWTKNSGDGTITSPTKATTAFSQTLEADEDTEGSFRCTVTDSLGVAASLNVAANFTSTSFN